MNADRLRQIGSTQVFHAGSQSGNLPDNRAQTPHMHRTAFGAVQVRTPRTQRGSKARLYGLFSFVSFVVGMVFPLKTVEPVDFTMTRLPKVFPGSERQDEGETEAPG
jgi:hypothetical protein